jgi:hypothetical protein
MQIFMGRARVDSYYALTWLVIGDLLRGASPLASILRLFRAFRLYIEYIHFMSSYGAFMGVCYLSAI